MDFGDILSQWDSIQKNRVPKNKGPQICRKKANAPTKEEKEAVRQGYSYEQIMDQNSQKRINPMELWHFIFYRTSQWNKISGRKFKMDSC